MDDALNVASAVSGLLSLTIQIVQLTQKYTSRLINLPPSVARYLADLVSLKAVLSDIQNALALPSTASGISTTAQSALANELWPIQVELENLLQRLEDAQNHKASFLLRNLLWPFQEDETANWANSLRHCKHRLESTILLSGL